MAGMENVPQENLPNKWWRTSALCNLEREPQNDPASQQQKIILQDDHEPSWGSGMFSFKNQLVSSVVC